jgi:hypothetical protein
MISTLMWVNLGNILDDDNILKGKGSDNHYETCDVIETKLVLQA